MIQKLKDNWDSLEIKKRQQIGGIAICSVVIFLVFLILVNVAPKKTEKKPDEPNFEGISSSKSDVEDVWLVESADKFKQLNALIKEKDKRIAELSKKYDDIDSRLNSINDDETVYLKQEISDLRKKIDNLKTSKPSSPTAKTNNYNKTSNSQNYNSNSGEPFSKTGVRNSSYNNSSYNSNSVPETRGIMLLSDSFTETEKKSYDLSNYIPAGSYVKAVLIQAVDASVGLSSQADPRPVLFKITHDARSASKDGKRLSVDIDGCMVTGAASGDLSSERAYIRLLKMTCKEGEKAIETTIEGHAVDASDGKTGIAGKVVSRTGDLIAKGMLAGLIAGAGQGASQKFYPGVNVSSGFTNSSSLTNKDIAGLGLSQGISNASKTMEEYYIRRLEQIQPVISVASGKEVELVFISGAYLDGRIIPQQNNNNSANSNQKSNSSSISKFIK